jgi:DNA-binding transcriptional MerR regulator
VEKVLPPIPAKRYFTIGEVSELCGVKPYVLRYWEQEFTQLKPMKRRGNRRYYQHHEVLLIRRIRDLLYEQGFTISGARNQLVESAGRGHSAAAIGAIATAGDGEFETGDEWADAPSLEAAAAVSPGSAVTSVAVTAEPTWAAMRDELISIRSLLTA